MASSQEFKTNLRTKRRSVVAAVAAAAAAENMPQKHKNFLAELKESPGHPVWEAQHQAFSVRMTPVMDTFVSKE